MPKIIENMEQGSSTWHAYRQSKIGSSDAAIIMDMSPYTTKFQLWQRKLGLISEQEETGSMRRGKQLEWQALTLFQAEKSLEMNPTVVESETHPFLCASLDGLSADGKYACEIKCLNLNDHDNEYVPEHYKPQLQHQMLVCDLQEITYVGYHPNSVKPFYTIQVKRDEEFLADYIPKAITFWKCVQEFDPPPLCDRDYLDYSKNAEYISLDAAYIDIDEKIKGLEKQKEELRKLMEQMSEGRNVKGLYTKMTHYTSQGRIDYKKAVTENLPELALEKYRGKPISTIRITKV